MPVSGSRERGSWQGRSAQAFRKVRVHPLISRSLNVLYMLAVRVCYTTLLKPYVNDSFYIHDNFI